MALIAGSCVLLVACTIQGLKAPRHHRSEAGVAASATAGSALPGKDPALTPDSAAAVAVAASSELDGGTASEELPLCDLADMSVSIPPESCPLAAVNAEPAAPEPSALFAPMCDASAASIAAAIEIPELDRGRFEPLPCDGQRWLELLRSQAREGGIRLIAGEDVPRRSPQPPSLPLAGHDSIGAVAMQLDWPERTASSTLEASSYRGLARRPGHPARVYRPPSI
jgi:hypothetical protein